MTTIARSRNAELSRAASEAATRWMSRNGSDLLDRELDRLIARAESRRLSESRWEFVADLYNGLIVERDEIIRQEVAKPRAQRRVKERMTEALRTYHLGRENLLGY